MLMMRLQRVGRRNDPSYRIVVTNRQTGPKSNKHVAVLGSYSPQKNHVQIDAAAAKEWLSKGVQASDTVHNILVNENVIEGKKVNALPKKSPIVDEEALKAQQEAEEKAQAEAEAGESSEEAAAEETPAEETNEEASTEESETDAATEETEAEAEKAAA